MKLVSIYFPGMVIPKVILVLDESAGDTIINDVDCDIVKIHVGGEVLSFKEYSHFSVDTLTTQEEENAAVTKIEEFVNNF